VPPHAGTSAHAVEHNLGTDWVKCYPKPKTEAIFQQCTFVQLVRQPHKQMCWQCIRGQCNSGLTRLGSPAVSRCHFRNSWV